MRSENKSEKQTFWPTQTWRSRFAAKYNVSYEETSGSQFSKEGYKSQLVSALVFNRAIRYMFKIPAGVGNIRNVDESMCYTYNTSKKSWTI